MQDDYDDQAGEEDDNEEPPRPRRKRRPLDDEEDEPNYRDRRRSSGGDEGMATLIPYKNPTAKGAGHAIVALVLGGLALVGDLSCIAIPIVMAIANSKK